MLLPHCKVIRETKHAQEENSRSFCLLQTILNLGAKQPSVSSFLRWEKYSAVQRLIEFVSRDREAKELEEEEKEGEPGNKAHSLSLLFLLSLEEGFFIARLKREKVA